MKDIKKIVIAALFAALACVTTMAIKIPTPTMGYIHPGDGMVLLCGILLGPGIGGLAAGIGSMLADLFSGYASYALGTLVIKALTAVAAGMLYRALPGKNRVRIALGGLVGELIMVGGYYLYEIGMTVVAGSGLAAAATAAAAGIMFNVVQAVSGILIALVLFPVLRKIPTFRAWTEKTA
ncbi:MAG: ECF transporter S component [Intestinibacillus sp.]